MTRSATKRSKIEDRARAAVLVAEDDLSDEEIAAQLGVHRTTLARWKRTPEFAALVGNHIGQIQAGMLKLAIAKKHKRLKVLDRIHANLLTVIAERAEEYAAMAAADRATPHLRDVRNMVGQHQVPAGGGTGLILRELKQIGAGRDATLVEHFSVDTATIREIRALHEQAARELGQWVDRSETEQTTKEIRIIGVDAEAI